MNRRHLACTPRGRRPGGLPRYPVAGTARRQRCRQRPVPRSCPRDQDQAGRPPAQTQALDRPGAARQTAQPGRESCPSRGRSSSRHPDPAERAPPGEYVASHTYWLDVPGYIRLVRCHKRTHGPHYRPAPSHRNLPRDNSTPSGKRLRPRRNVTPRPAAWKPQPERPASSLTSARITGSPSSPPRPPAAGPWPTTWTTPGSRTRLSGRLSAKAWSWPIPAGRH